MLLSKPFLLACATMSAATALPLKAAVYKGSTATRGEEIVNEPPAIARREENIFDEPPSIAKRHEDIINEPPNIAKKDDVVNEPPSIA
ncbi:hypothetical protein F4811DRAFT_63011 [Daldinia bambusicola]|nr:hypothetical protein F4811DRAFT_63011 [Daldinia bambusicola]